MKVIPEDAEYFLGGVPDSVLLLAFAVSFGIGYYKLFSRGQSNHD
jgi:hypothetical protein